MRHYSDWLKAYLEYTDTLEAPTSSHFWAGVGAIASVLQGKVWLDMSHFKWKPNFFIIFVAPPGIANKSTTIGIARNLLSEVEGTSFGPDSGTWQGITEAFKEAITDTDIGGVVRAAGGGVERDADGTL